MKVEASEKVKAFVHKQSALLPGEAVDAVLGSGNSVILLTPTRLIVVKVGWIAGSTGGGRITAFDYADVTALQTQLGWVNGTLSVQSPGYGATQTGDYWNGKNQQSWVDLPNVIPWGKLANEIYSVELACAHRRIHDAKHRTSAPAQVPSTLVHELERLAQLHQSGMLSDAEFLAAKARLING